MIVDSDYWKAKVGNGFTLEQEALQYLKVNNLAIEGKPEGLTINTTYAEAIIIPAMPPRVL